MYDQGGKRKGCQYTYTHLVQLLSVVLLFRDYLACHSQYLDNHEMVAPRLWGAIMILHRDGPQCDAQTLEKNQLTNLKNLTCATPPLFGCHPQVKSNTHGGH